MLAMVHGLQSHVLSCRLRMQLLSAVVQGYLPAAIFSALHSVSSAEAATQRERAGCTANACKQAIRSSEPMLLAEVLSFNACFQPVPLGGPSLCTEAVLTVRPCRPYAPFLTLSFLTLISFTSALPSFPPSPPLVCAVPGGGPPKKGGPGDGKDQAAKKKKFEAKPLSRVHKKKKKLGPSTSTKLPKVFPAAKCKLRQLKLERIKDFLLMEEEFIRNQEVLRPKEERESKERDKVEELRGQPLTIGTLEEMIDDTHCIVSSPAMPDYYTNIASFVDSDQLEPGCSVLLHNKTMTVVGILGEEADPLVSVMKVEKAPSESYADIGGLEKQIMEIKEAVELPLTHPEIYEDIGIKPLKGESREGERESRGESREAGRERERGGLRVGERGLVFCSSFLHLNPPPSLHACLPFLLPLSPSLAPAGVILYGVPGTGKTLLAKAVANSTSATFLRVVGSELIQKYLGEGPKLVRELFRVAAEHAPSIIFLDEIDAIGTKRYDSSSSGEREIQRTMIELLTQLDGFDDKGDVKVIMATNRIESLDPALIRPGRIDRKIEFPMPDIKTKRMIFGIHTGRMSLAEDVDIEEFVLSKEELSGADIKAICTEAGMLALRERRMKVNQEDFRKAKEKALYRKKGTEPVGMYL